MPFRFRGILARSGAGRGRSPGFASPSTMGAPNLSGHLFRQGQWIGGADSSFERCASSISLTW
jgi:hypothetical protein